MIKESKLKEEQKRDLLKQFEREGKHVCFNFKFRLNSI